jgi:hypothetical protein
MVPNQSSLGDGSSNNTNNTSSSASRAGNGTLSGGVTIKKNKIKLHFSLPFTSNDKVNPHPAIKKVYKAALKLDSTACLLPNDCSKAFVTKLVQIHSGKHINAFDLQCYLVHRQFLFYAMILTKATFRDIKSKVFPWLKDNCTWIKTHSMKMNHTANLGFLLGTHPMLMNRDNVKAILTPYLTRIEFNLAPQKELYYNEKNERNMTSVVMIEVDATKVAR